MRLIVLGLFSLTLLAQQPVYRIDTLAGADPINDGGPAVEGYLALPNDIAAHPDGGFVISDESNNLIRRVSADGTITTIAGYRGVRGDQDTALGRAVFPRSVAVSPSGRVIYAESSRVYEILEDGRISILAGSTSGYDGDGGPAEQASLRSISDVAFGPDGTAYIADSSSDTIRAVSPDGIISTIAGVDQSFGFSGDDGPATQAQINNPGELAVAPDGALLFVDRRNRRIRRVGLDGIITTVVGNGENGFPDEGQPALESKMTTATLGLAVAPNGDILFSTSTWAYVVGADGIVQRYAGRGSGRSRGDGGPALDADINGLESISIDVDGTVYLLAQLGNRVRAVDEAGIITTVAGRDRRGAPAPSDQAVLYLPNDVAAGPDGSVYVAEPEHHIVRRIAPDGEVSIFAGADFRGFRGDGGPANQAWLFVPQAVDVNPATGVVYIADASNRRIRQVTPDGTISTFAGSGQFGGGGDGGPAIEAEFLGISDVAVGPDGRVYVSDVRTNTVRVVGTDGVITRFAGNGDRGRDGDGGPAIDAELNFPTKLLIAADGTVYIHESVNRTVRRVSPAGIIDTYVEPRFSAGGMVLDADGSLLLSNASSGYIERWVPGEPREYVAGLNAGFGFSGDGGLAEDASLREPQGLFRTPDGRILIADRRNHRIRVMEDSGNVAAPMIADNAILQAASFFRGRMASDAIVSVFGENLAVRSEAATSTPLPTRLGGSQADVTDAQGTTKPAQYFFASSGQLNLLIPPGLATGDGTLRVRTAGGMSEVPLGLNRDAPGLFSANANGQGVAAAVWQLVRADNSRESGFTFEFDAAQGASVAVPVPLGAEGDGLYLTLFGTGIRNANTVRVLVDGVEVPVLFSGPQPDFAGLDQINIGPLPRSLAGKTVMIRLETGGRASNLVTITLQ